MVSQWQCLLNTVIFPYMHQQHCSHKGPLYVSIFLHLHFFFSLKSSLWILPIWDCRALIWMFKIVKGSPICSGGSRKVPVSASRFNWSQIRPIELWARHLQWGGRQSQPALLPQFSLPHQVFDSAPSVVFTQPSLGYGEPFSAVLKETDLPLSVTSSFQASPPQWNWSQALAPHFSSDC